MTPAEVISEDLAQTAQDMRDRKEPFAFATIVRTAGSTAAKPGAKALLSADGTILQGWLGGGCTRGAVKKAAIEALASGVPQLVSVAPEALLTEQGVSAGATVGGMRFARNGCPSQGSIDIFIEPCLPMPLLTVIGASPVAEALSSLAPEFQWSVRHDVSEDDTASQNVIIVATQGQGDLAALERALHAQPHHIAFVGSSKKYRALAEKLAAKGIADDKIASVKAPAGLDIGAVTSEEIALSILAELVMIRRSEAKTRN